MQSNSLVYFKRIKTNINNKYYLSCISQNESWLIFSSGELEVFSIANYNFMVRVWIMSSDMKQ